MSSVYNLEPNPTAKVVLHTTNGDLELELFAKQTPKSSRNFLQLCLDGYYDNTVFHRLVKGFILQGGDPTGTGQGGESSYDGEPFADEFHSRLKFNRRGLLGMANTGKKDDNGSQFFFTLGNTPELTGQNTMFGRVAAGDTIYNLMKMGEAEIAEGSEDRPLYPTKITSTEIIINPFEDMEKRVRVAERTETESKKMKKPKRKAGKALLSFGDDGDEPDSQPTVKKAKYNTKLVSAGEQTPPTVKNTQIPRVPDTEKAIPFRKPTRRSPSQSPPPKRRPSSPREKTRSPSPVSKIDRVNAQIAAVKASMQRKTTSQNAEPVKKKTIVEEMIPATSTRGRKRGAGANNAASEQAALHILSKFKSKLEAAPLEASKIRAPQILDDIEQNGRDNEQPGGEDKPASTGDEEVPCDLHFIVGCQSCTAWDKQEHDESDDDTGWMSHSLSFAKDRLGKDLEWKRKNEEELVVIDPREKAQGFKEERRSKKDRDGDGIKGRVWSAGKSKERA